MVKYPKERMIVNELKNFIVDDIEYRILVLVGIRRIGKTIVLKQLQEYVLDSVYIDFSEKDSEEKLIQFMQNPKPLLLMDEISMCKGYVDVIRHIEDQSVQNGYKVIITGSSPSHLLSLYGGPLGGGRACMKRMSLLNFTEYLYFTDKISNYDCTYNPTSDDFRDYLNLKGIGAGLKITFDLSYFYSFYSDIELSNRNSSLVRDGLKVEEKDLASICDLLAYNSSLTLSTVPLYVQM